MIFSIITGVCLGVFALVGLIVGLVKGYTKVQTWASDYVIAGFITIGVGAILKKVSANAIISGIVLTVCVVVSLLVCIFMANLIKKLINRSFEKRDDDLRSYGGVGVFNRIWGGLTLALKGLVIAAIIAVLGYLFLDLIHIDQLAPSFYNSLSEIYTGALWLAIRPFLMDFLIIGVLHLALRHGYSAGFAETLWKLVVLGLIVGAGFLAYSLVFSTTVFDSASSALSGKIAGWFSQINGGQNLALNAAKGIIVGIIFILLAITIGVASFFVSRVITSARQGAAFFVADGILGAIVGFVIALVALLFLGYVIAPVCDLDFMQSFTKYFDSSMYSRFFYTENLLLKFGLPELPIRKFLTP